MYSEEKNKKKKKEKVISAILKLEKMKQSKTREFQTPE